MGEQLLMSWAQRITVNGVTSDGGQENCPFPDFLHNQEKRRGNIDPTGC